MLSISRVVMRIHSFVFILAINTIAACSSAATPATQLIVTVDGDPQVAAALVRIRVLVYPEDASSDSTPAHQQVFTLTRGTPKAEAVKLPFSFGIEKKMANSAIIVVKGYSSFAANAQPMVEHKLAATFSTRETIEHHITLAEACWNRANQCESLTLTCASADHGAARAGSCVDITRSQDAGSIDGLDASQPDAGLDAEPPITDPPPATCEVPNECDEKNYPCVPSPSFGYSCQGQVAQWPMPDSLPGSKFAPEYDTESAPGQTIDKVTKLIWQAKLPRRYRGCTGRVYEADDSCTWAEARAYCEQLTLGGHRWRLPGVVELASLLDYTVTGRSSIDQQVFPDTPSTHFWTGSPNSFDPNAAWTVSFLGGQTSIFPQSNAYPVRCVRSVEARAGTPEKRFEKDDTMQTVRDTHTQLEWNLSEYATETSWEEAEARCAMLGDDYRLPSPKELLTIFDPVQLEQAVSSAFELPSYAIPHCIWSTQFYGIANGRLVMSASAGFIVSDAGLRVAKQRNPLSGGPSFNYHALCVH